MKFLILLFGLSYSLTTLAVEVQNNTEPPFAPETKTDIPGTLVPPTKEQKKSIQPPVEAVPKKKKKKK